MRTTALIICVLAASAAAEEATPRLSPKQAWQDMQAKLNAARSERNFDEYRRLQQAAPKEFLAAWAAAERLAKGEERYFLGQFQAMARKYSAAMGSFAACNKDESLPENLRGPAWMGYARATQSALTAGEIDSEQGIEAIRWVEREMAGLDAPQRTSLHGVLGAACDLAGQADAAIKHHMESARGRPAGAYSAARSIGSILVKESVDLDRIEAARERGTVLFTALSKLYQGYVEELGAKLELLENLPEDKRGTAHEKQVQRAKTQHSRAQSTLKRIGGQSKPLELLGTAAPEWTAEHVFQGGKTLADYRGKVVILDFWATWCPWCIRSFPALRDVMKDYKDQPLALVGVTASANYVYEQRYDLDDDFKEKATGRPQPTLRLTAGGDEEEHRKNEKDVIAKFIKNHEMNWDVIMIDKTEPAAKYALSGWPHAVVIDKQGRIRFLKAGALLKDRPAAVKKFRAVLDKLLAEEAPTTK